MDTGVEICLLCVCVAEVSTKRLLTTSVMKIKK